MENKNDFLKDWLEGKISTAELKARREKRDSTVQQFEELISRTSGLKAPEKTSKEQAWEKLSAKLTETPKTEAKVVSMNRWIPVSIAAAISFLVIAFFVWNKTEVSSQVAETKKYVLPDGSEVTLNASSTIEFSQFRFSNNRTVKLKGEAFFNVTKGSSFTVESEKGTVTVLGTSFNVQARPANFEVSCFTGKVKVASGNGEVILTKGLRTKLNQGQLAAAESFDVNKSTWQHGDIYFENASLQRVIEELELQFRVKISFSGDNTRLYTGYFNNKNIDEALALVFKPMALSYERDGNRIVVK